jgi:hypothetical protein
VHTVAVAWVEGLLPPTFTSTARLPGVFGSCVGSHSFHGLKPSSAPAL